VTVVTLIYNYNLIL